MSTANLHRVTCHRADLEESGVLRVTVAAGDFWEALYFAGNLKGREGWLPIFANQITGNLPPDPERVVLRFPNFPPVLGVGPVIEGIEE